ncbi:MAG: hypothetical protein VZR53_08900 [Prevotella sp.]|nr:hypothetical protein [Prevotella sp.]
MAGGIKGSFDKSNIKVKAQTGKIKSPKSPSTKNHKSSSKKATTSTPKSSKSKSSSTNQSKKSSNLVYDRAAVKRANERLRKMEKVYTHHGSPLAEYNTAYQTRKHDLEMNEKSGGSIFKRDKTGIGVRYLSEKEFNQLNNNDKKRFLKNLQNWLDADSSQKSTFDAAVDANYDIMNKAHGLAEKGISKDDWLDVLRVYHTRIVPVDNSHYGSKVIIDAIENLNIPKLNVIDLEKAMELIVSSRMSEIPEEWFSTNY